VLGRAIVHDSAAAGQAASRMALLTMVQSLAPGVGPAVGGFLRAWFGWRSIFVALVALGVVTLGGVWLALPETAAGSGRMLGSYLILLRSHAYRGYMLGGAFTSTSFYAYLMASPFIFTQMLHRPATEVGLCYLAVMSGVPIGSFAVSQLASRMRLNLLLRMTSAIAVLGATLFLAATASAMLNHATVLLPMIVFSIGVGASGLYGFMQMANGALCTLAVGFFPANPALSAASVLLAGILLGQFSSCVQRGRGPPREWVSEDPKRSVQRLPVDDFEPSIINL
jgi:MFS transporter, DHA1 family, multidrug resistance protein